MIFSGADIIEARRLGAATLHEAAGRIGALPSAIKPVSPDMRMAGPAFTVHVPPGDNLWIHHGLYAAAPGDVLVVSTSGGFDWGYWGDILNEAAMAQRLGGLVIDGGVRDSEGLMAMPLPVFSRGVSIRGTIKGYEARSWLCRPVQIGDVVIAQGDLVVGDRDGVVALPAADVPQILVAGQRREADEAEKIASIRAGMRTVDLYDFTDRLPNTQAAVQ